jgi:hypothetical protein
MSDTCREPSDSSNIAPAWMRLSPYRERASARVYDDANTCAILDMHRQGVPQSDIARLLDCTTSRVHRVVSEMAR